MPVEVDMYIINDGRYVGIAVRTLIVPKGTSAATFPDLTSLKGIFDYKLSDTLQPDDIREFDVQTAINEIEKKGFHIFGTLVEDPI